METFHFYEINSKSFHVIQLRCRLLCYDVSIKTAPEVSFTSIFLPWKYVGTFTEVNIMEISWWAQRLSLLYFPYGDGRPVMLTSLDRLYLS